VESKKASFHQFSQRLDDEVAVLNGKRAARHEVDLDVDQQQDGPISVD
jgi:hypothetical protein